VVVSLDVCEPQLLQLVLQLCGYGMLTLAAVADAAAVCHHQVRTPWGSLSGASAGMTQRSAS
jgi:hypothetical protein